MPSPQSLDMIHHAVRYPDDVLAGLLHDTQSGNVWSKVPTDGRQCRARLLVTLHLQGE